MNEKRTTGNERHAHTHDSNITYISRSGIVTATKRVTAVDVQRTTGVECGFDIIIVIILYLHYDINNILYSLQTAVVGVRVSHYTNYYFNIIYVYNIRFVSCRWMRIYNMKYYIIP